jgi:GAF domain-containing protein
MLHSIGQRDDVERRAHESLGLLRDRVLERSESLGVGRVNRETRAAPRRVHFFRDVRYEGGEHAVHGGHVLPENVRVRRTRAALVAYRGGKSSLADVLAARRDAIEVRLQALQLEADTSRLWAQINFLFPTDSTAAVPALITNKESK